MKKRLMGFLLALSLCLSGCASLLERSYSVVEPYTDRYWVSGAEDTLRVESYQDLVNSLLMLIRQHAEAGVIRGYGEASSYLTAQSAFWEVRQETALGSYLLKELTFSYESGTDYCTLTFQMVYREGTEDPESIMALSDSQSLVDLLRLYVREGHEKLTAQFVHDMPRQEVAGAVESLWQELCRDEAGEAGEDEPEEDEPEAGEPGEDESAPEGEEPEAPQDPGEEPLGGVGLQEAGEPEEEPVEEPAFAEYPPCPWTVRFYPDMESMGIVEILLRPTGPGDRPAVLE